MNYHLNRDGQNLGIFPGEELERRRATGELTGRELVWAPGMAQWQTLDFVLGRVTGNPAATSVKAADSNKSHLVAWGIIVVILLVGVGMIAVTFHTLRRPATVQSGQDRPSGMQAASKPVVVDPTTLTKTDIDKAQREFRVRQYIDGYLLRGDRSAEYDGQVLNLLTNWISSNFGGPINTNFPSLSELSKKVADNPNCTDPLALTVAAINSIELHEMNIRLERAVKVFEHSPHLGYPKFFATVMLGNKLIDERIDRKAALDLQALQYFQDTLTDGSLKPEDQQDIAESLISGWGKSFFYRNSRSICLMVEKQGHDFQWLALTLHGEDEIDAAWKARGSGYVDSVTAAGWKGFAYHLANARKDLTKAWKLHPRWPLAPGLMIYVSLGGSDIAEMRLWFDRTVAAQIDYPLAWQDMRWGLRPRWYGDLDSMLAFGETALKTRRFDTDVPENYFDSVSDVESEQECSLGQHIYGRDDVWPHLREMYEGYVAEPTLSNDRRASWRSTYAAVAYLAGKYDVAREQLQQLNWRPYPHNLQNWGRDLSLMPMEVAARTGSQAEKVAAAQSALQTFDPAAAMKIYAELASATNTDERTRAYAQERQYTLQMNQKLATGQWVDFMPVDTNFTGWNISFGKFKLLPDGALEVHANEEGHLIFSRVPLGTNIEVRGEFEVVSSSTRSFQAGLALGLPQFDGYNWISFRIKRNDHEGDLGSMSKHWILPQVSAPAVLNNFTNTFYFGLHNGRATAKINDVNVLNDLPQPRYTYFNPHEFLFGLGAFNDSNSTVIRYRHIQIRLTAPTESGAEMFVPTKTAP
jgi:hypothetical protein